MPYPRKHHYIPAFYLKQWVTADGRLCEHKLIPGRTIAPRRTTPGGTGYQINLYRVEGVPEELAQRFESEFMHLVDTHAFRALEDIKLLGAPTDAKKRSAWTRFILSLLFRTPEAVETIKGHIKEMWLAGLRDLESHYAERRLPDDPTTFAEYFARTNPAAPQIAAIRFLHGVIDNQKIGPAIFNMHWSRIILTKSNYPLLTSDRPLEMPLGLGHPDAYIALPIGPNMIFLASRNTSYAAKLNRANHSEIARKLNEQVVSQARIFVWGGTDSQLTFVKKKIATLPDRTIISDKQRAEAIAEMQANPFQLEPP